MINPNSTQTRCVYCGKTFPTSEQAKPVNHNCKDYVFIPGDTGTQDGSIR